MIPTWRNKEEALAWQQGFNEGIDARVRSSDLFDNPHPVSTLEHLGWGDGWCLAEEMIRIGKTQA